MHHQQLQKELIQHEQFIDQIRKECSLQIRKQREQCFKQINQYRTSYRQLMDQERSQLEKQLQMERQKNMKELLSCRASHQNILSAERKIFQDQKKNQLASYEKLLQNIRKQTQNKRQNLQVEQANLKNKFPTINGEDKKTQQNSDKKKIEQETRNQYKKLEEKLCQKQKYIKMLEFEVFGYQQKFKYFQNEAKRSFQKEIQKLTKDQDRLIRELQKIQKQKQAISLSAQERINKYEEILQMVFSERDKEKKNDQKSEQNKFKSEQNIGMCKICLKDKATYVNIECGHINICQNCIKDPLLNKNKCIVCRTNGRYRQVFISHLGKCD